MIIALKMIATAIAGYLLGSINSAVIFSKTVYRCDIRKQGSGNAGMTNMLRVFGKKAAALTFIGDFLKGILAVVLGMLLNGTAGAAVGGACAIIGHNWPLYFGFKGGKGVLTAFSVMIVIAPVPTLVVFAIFIMVVALTRYVSLGSIMAAVCLPIIVFFAGDVLYSERGLGPVFYLSLFVTAMILFRHRSNIVRLIRGTESKLGAKSK